MHETTAPSVFGGEINLQTALRQTKSPARFIKMLGPAMHNTIVPMATHGLGRYTLQPWSRSFRKPGVICLHLRDMLQFWIMLRDLDYMCYMVSPTTQNTKTSITSSSLGQNAILWSRPFRKPGAAPTTHFINAWQLLQSRSSVWRIPFRRPLCPSRRLIPGQC